MLCNSIKAQVRQSLSVIKFRQLFVKQIGGRAQSTICRNLICVDDWKTETIHDILQSAKNLKTYLRNDSHFKKLDLLSHGKVMILQEDSEPSMNMAVSKAASLLGADDVSIISDVEANYQGKIFSKMADVIFVITKKYMCLRRFAEKSSVPVLCVQSRTHCTIQSLATTMSIIEEYGTMEGLNVAYIGSAHPVLNSYLLLCPMLGANIKYKCSCAVVPVSPLLHKKSKDMCEETATEMKQCLESDLALKDASVVIAGPTPKNKDRLPVFKLSVGDICKASKNDWIFYHTCPRGEEVNDELFWHNNSRTFEAFDNMQYIAAALMAYTVKDYQFQEAC